MPALSRALIGLLLATLFLSAASPALAEEPSVSQKMTGKLVRGTVNFATGWIEIPLQMYRVWNDEGWVAGLFRGPIDGFGLFVARTFAGMVEIVTFPLPIPTFDAMIQPAYAWEPEPRRDTMAAPP
jgi:putative exosortase-associated protein (TIGR04073 family)